jgi:hypothetical protein
MLAAKHGVSAFASQATQLENIDIRARLSQTKWGSG